MTEPEEKPKKPKVALPKKPDQAKGKQDKKPPAAETASTPKKSGQAKGKQAQKPPVEGAVVAPKPKSDYIPRLHKLYRERVAPDLMKKFGFTNPMLAPKLIKIVLNIGVGTLHQDPKLAESLADELKIITGQKPVFTRARKSISNFKLRQGMMVGCSVTLRQWQMYEFFDRLISIAIPRIRDFRGLGDRSFDGRGNYTFGVKEQIIFPEIDYDKVVKIHGMDITICTSARNDEEAFELLRAFGFPIRHRTPGQKEAD
jgi:large subunit ribosomal protein L5